MHLLKYYAHTFQDNRLFAFEGVGVVGGVGRVVAG